MRAIFFFLGTRVSNIIETAGPFLDLIAALKADSIDGERVARILNGILTKEDRRGAVRLLITVCNLGEKGLKAYSGDMELISQSHEPQALARLLAEGDVKGLAASLEKTGHALLRYRRHVRADR